MNNVPPFTVSAEAINLHPIFEHLPVENRVYSNQQQYYDAITASTNAGQSGQFVDFMLEEIYKTLKEHQGSPLPNTEDEFDAKFGKEFGVKFGVKFGVNERKVLLILTSNPSSSDGDIAEQVGLTKRGVEKQLKKFRDLGIIARKGSDKTGYWEIVKEDEV
ncbi:MAG: winged helix-turn-helix transcriptional regulator [Prevotella sp.]|nr:winged helix-turn-helix transcriptional regulator [Prevotella sp.]